MSTPTPTDPSSGAGNNHFGSTENQETNLEELGRALGWGGTAPNSGAEGAMSDLSLDEVLLLHSAALEPAQVVFGVGIVSIAAGVWTWNTGPVDDARQAFQSALGRAKESIQRQARDVGAVGVLGLDIDIQLSPYRATVIATGTAVRSLKDKAGHPQFKINYRSPFLCDLSARDFAVLSSSGWYPLDLVAGASYIRAPQRGIGAAIGQATQNVELANYTQTLYQAREAAMEEMQNQIRLAGGTGLVDAKIIDRPVAFARHVVEFIAYGTAIKMLAPEHSHPKMEMVLSLDDVTPAFEASSLT